MSPSSHEDRVESWADQLDPLADQPAAGGAAELPVAQRESLDAIRSRLADEALWSGPPAGLRAALLDRVRTEQDEPDEQDEPAPATSRPGRRRTPWLLAVAAAVVLAAGAAVLWPRAELQTFPVAGTALAPQASAVVQLEPKSAGVAIRMEIKGLKPAPPGTYYAAWLRGPGGVVPVGTFHWHKGGIPIDLWSGVTTDRYPELFVTLQQEGAPPGPSDRVVLDGRTR